MTSSDRDRKLGLYRPISRRDFLDGLAIAAGGAMLGGPTAAEAAVAAPYPPARTGLRGSDASRYEALHALRDGTFWSTAPRPVATGQSYDLVVVGAGISGLAAAHAFRKARPRASVLLLDSHDDFGGHAARNELGSGARFRIGYGGTQSINSPAPYSTQAKALIAELGIRVADYPKHVQWPLYRARGLGQGFFFNRETFGEDRLVRFSGRLETDAAFTVASPLSARAKADLSRLGSERLDPWPGESETAKRARLARMSYRDFLLDVWRVDASLIALFDTRTHGLYGIGIDGVPAQDAHGLGMPGFRGLGLSERSGPGQNLDSIRWPDAGDYQFHFPDGNATIARLLVRRLIPKAIGGRTAADIVTQRASYAALDRRGAEVRIRLGCPVVRARHVGRPGRGRRVEVVYQQGKALRSVTARRVILACWHTAIPMICPELPAAQREALAYALKVPVVYTNVLVRNWAAFQRLGVSRITCPGFWHSNVSLDFPVSIGRYRFPQTPEEPIVLHMTKAACRPGLSAREQHRAGRRELYETTFETIERSIREQLDRILGPGGFVAADDILAITVNRWPHGYSYQYNSLFDAFWLDGGTTPCEIARQPFGRISIANADAGAYAYTDSAIDHGLRAAREALRRL